MSLYALGNIQCHLKSPKRRRCFVMDGANVLHCSEQCDAYLKIEEMFMNYKSYQLDSELTIQEFLNHKVKRIGARISQSA